MHIVQICCGNIGWYMNRICIVDDVGQTDDGGYVPTGLNSSL